MSDLTVTELVPTGSHRFQNQQKGTGSTGSHYVGGNREPVNRPFCVGSGSGNQLLSSRRNALTGVAALPVKRPLRAAADQLQEASDAA